MRTRPPSQPATKPFVNGVTAPMAMPLRGDVSRVFLNSVPSNTMSSPRLVPTTTRSSGSHAWDVKWRGSPFKFTGSIFSRSSARRNIFMNPSPVASTTDWSTGCVSTACTTDSGAHRCR